MMFDFLYEIILDLVIINLLEKEVSGSLERESLREKIFLIHQNQKMYKSD